MDYKYVLKSIIKIEIFLLCINRVLEVVNSNNLLCILMYKSDEMKHLLLLWT